MRTLSSEAVVLHEVSQPEADRFLQTRLTRAKLRGGWCLSLRQWWRPPGQADFVPTKKGVTFPIELAGDLAAALAILAPEQLEHARANGGAARRPTDT